jgi:hypothetical protein
MVCRTGLATSKLTNPAVQCSHGKISGKCGWPDGTLRLCRFERGKSALASTLLNEMNGTILPQNVATLRLAATSIQLPEFIFRILFYPIHRIDLSARSLQELANTATFGLDEGLLQLCSSRGFAPPMPQEVSVSYQAVKSKVYRLIDALVVGEKTEAEVQESIRRWWDLIHPADRPIAHKYLLIVLERSCLALDAVEEGLAESSDSEALRPSHSAKAIKLVGRVVKQAAISPTV